MNILWINHEYPPIGGGGATVCRALSREFASLGHSVTIVSAAYKDAYIDTPPHESAGGIDVHRLKCRRKSRDQASFFEMWSYLVAAFRFVPKMAKKSKFDAAIISFGIPSGPLGWYLYKRFKIPYIVRLGGGDIPGTQKRFKFAYAVLSPFLKAIWRNAAYVVANSRGLQARAERFYGKARFVVIPNGVEASSFIGEGPGARSEESGVDGVFGIVTTARIVERKGIQHVIEALPHLIEKTGGNIHYTVVGDGPYRKEIENLAFRLGVTRHLEITGMLPFEDVVNRLAAADVFVLASHWEGMPNAVTEAMAAGLPIIMSDCEGSEELVDRNGYIVSSGENVAAELAEKLLILYNNRAIAEEMGKISRERVVEHFRRDKCAAEYLKLLEKA